MKFQPRILISAIVLFVIASGAYFLVSSKPSQKACTMEVKICPDGTAVGRTGPNCEFAPCPTPTVYTERSRSADWKTFTSEYRYTFRYPPTLSIKTGSDVRSFAYDVQLDSPEYNMSICKPNYCALPAFDKVPISYIEQSITRTFRTIDDKPSYRIAGDLIISQKNKLYHIIEVVDLGKNQKMQIEANALSSTTPEELQENFDQILSTFIFTK